MDQLILFNKSNKNVESEKKMDHSISQTKHTLKARDRKKERKEGMTMLIQTTQRPKATPFAASVALVFTDWLTGRKDQAVSVGAVDG